MHLDEWDRFNYVCEAFRVLKPGGRLYVDNFNLLSPSGWGFFMDNMLDYHPVDRPANISKSSNPSSTCISSRRVSRRFDCAMALSINGLPRGARSRIGSTLPC